MPSQRKEQERRPNSSVELRPTVRRVFDGTLLWTIRTECPWWDEQLGPSLVFSDEAGDQFRVRDFPADWMWLGTRELIALCPALQRRYEASFGPGPIVLSERPPLRE